MDRKGLDTWVALPWGSAPSSDSGSCGLRKGRLPAGVCGLAVAPFQPSLASPSFLIYLVLDLCWIRGAGVVPGSD